jgi:hypothetical protein
MEIENSRVEKIWVLLHILQRMDIRQQKQSTSDYVEQIDAILSSGNR